MKTFIKFFILPLTLMLSLGNMWAKEYKVVFDITSNDQKDWNTLLNNLENVKASLGKDSKMEVVAHGGALGLLVKKNSFQIKRMEKIAKSGVDFLACENTMKRKGVVKSELVDFAGTVPAGLVEVIEKQAQGWAYLKIGK